VGSGIRTWALLSPRTGEAIGFTFPTKYIGYLLLNLSLLLYNLPALVFIVSALPFMPLFLCPLSPNAYGAMGGVAEAGLDVRGTRR
jgi:hypothetical protein